MSTIEQGSTTGTDDTAAIEELHETVDLQRAAFLADPFPSLEERRELLGAIAGMVMSHKTQIEEAMSADFGVHPKLATVEHVNSGELIEAFAPPYGETAQAVVAAAFQEAGS